MKTIFMKKADWQAWDEALRSGKYKQASGKLHDPKTGGYCCLGVLQQCLTGETESIRITDSRTEPCVLPSYEWLEKNEIELLEKNEIEFKSGRDPWLESLEDFAAAANDGGVSFVEIADAIKEAVEFTD